MPKMHHACQYIAIVRVYVRDYFNLTNIPYVAYRVIYVEIIIKLGG